jgi:hypothetical protein
MSSRTKQKCSVRTSCYYSQNKLLSLSEKDIIIAEQLIIIDRPNFHHLEQTNINRDKKY